MPLKPTFNKHLIAQLYTSAHKIREFNDVMYINYR